MTLIKDSVYYIFDTETTGLTPPEDKVVELAVTVLQPDGSKWGWSSLVNPGRDIPPDASAIHHIVAKHVEGQPDMDGALKALGYHLKLDGIPTPPQVYVAHNAKFDSSFLPQLTKAPWLCTMRLARKLFPRLEHHSNQYLRYYFHLEVPEVEGKSAHRALEDSQVTAELLIYLLKSIPEDWPQDIEGLLDKLAEPFLLEICPFKKYKGCLWATVPRSYLNWILENLKDIDDDIRYTVNYYLGV